MKNMFNVKTKHLIELVKERNCVWDRSCPEYKHKGSRDKAWTEIYRSLDPDYDNMSNSEKHEYRIQITRKWYNIRDAYVKTRRNPSRTRTRPYVYKDILSFLDSIYFDAQGNTSENFIEEKENEQDSDDYKEVFIDIDENLHDTSTYDDETESPFKKRKIDDPDPNIVAVLANLIQREEDEDTAFFRSITPSVKSLSDESKLQFKIEVMKLIKKLKMKDNEPFLKMEVTGSDSE